jgi:hypothetical protein
MVRNNRKGRASVAGFNRPILYPPLKFCGVLKQEATARIANRRLPGAAWFFKTVNLLLPLVYLT